MKMSSKEILNDNEIYKIAKETLKKDNEDNIEIIDWQLTPGSSDLIGYMGDYYKLAIQINDNDEAVKTVLRYFVKTVPYSDDLHRDECERKGFFDKETAVYMKILPNVQRYAKQKLYATCYYARKDLIVLDDLSYEYKNLPNDVTYTMAHNRVVLRLLADFHASSIAWEQREGIQIGEQFQDALKEIHLSNRNEWYMTGVKAIIYLAQKHPKFQTIKDKKFINERLYDILRNVQDLTEPSKLYYNALCHRDTWDRNILFNFDKEGLPSSCVIVDFQLSRYCSPIIDVLFMLFITSRAELRRRNEAACLAFYFNEFQNRLKDFNLNCDFTEADFQAECRRMRLAAIVSWAISEPLTCLPEGFASSLRAAEPEKFDQYMNSDRSELLERVMALDSTYAEIIMAPVEELLNYLLENIQLCEYKTK